jgi:hypothetical protein
MKMGTVLLLREDGNSPRAEVAFPDGDRIRIACDQGGLTISRIGGDQQILFKADRGLVGHICAGLVASPKRIDVTPLRIVLAAVLQLSSAAEVEKAFRDAADQLS